MSDIVHHIFAAKVIKILQTANLLLIGISEYNGRFDIDAKFLGALKYCPCQFWPQFLGAIAEICFCRADMRGVGHRVFPALGQAERRVGERFFLAVR